MEEADIYLEYAVRLEKIWEDAFFLFHEFMFERGNEEGLTHVQIMLLKFLLDKESVTVSNVADFMGVTMAAASSLLDRLEKGGLITRDRSETDRRVVYAGLTPQGREVIEKFAARRRKKLQLLVTRMGREGALNYLKAQKLMLETLELILKERSEQEASNV
ncbi:MAG: MarR family transcriptional regulator [Actinobacteria bacterium]|nr:MarR family transcriptional regulator [Actinomycetota bacterium]